MSASLVGSEMCIRDSQCLWCAGGADLRVRAGATAHPGGPQGVRGGGSPVSYTHLTLPTICSV
eukprot:4658868-Alexandrium_andersonii.AAC.1